VPAPEAVRGKPVAQIADGQALREGRSSVATIY
jgi:hypothetical protein